MIHFQRRLRLLLTGQTWRIKSSHGGDVKTERNEMVNHPSGKLEPSEDDKMITRIIKVAGKQLDVIVLDHIIITEHGHFSFADKDIL